MSLGRSTAVAAGWALLATVAGRLVTLAAFIFLARWLAPEDFGLLAFALVYITYIETVADLGMTSAVIYWPGHDEDTAGVARITFLLSVAMGLFWFGVSWFAAPAVASFFHHEDAVPILRALALSLPLRALGATHDALAQKALRFQARFVPEFGLSVVKGSAAMALAASGFGVWALVYGHLLGTTAWMLLAWVIVPWRPRLPESWTSLGPLLTYGRGIVAVNVLAAILHHADIVVVGRMLGATALGFYQIAARLPEMTLLLMMSVVGKVLFPAFARVQSQQEDIGEAYLTATRFVSVLFVPAAVALALLAEPVVSFVLGDRWAPSVPILRALAAYAALRAIGSQSGETLKAIGRPGLLASLGLVKGAVLVPLIIFGARFGPVGVAIAMAISAAFGLAVNVYAIRQVSHVAVRDFAVALRPGLVAAAAVAAAIACWNLAGPHWPAWLELAGGALAALAAFALSLRFTMIDTLRRAAWGTP